MDKDYDTNIVPLYTVASLTPVEDEDGNLIDIEFELEPANLVADVINSSGDIADFNENDKDILVTDELLERINQVKEQYGLKNLILGLDEEDEL